MGSSLFRDKYIFYYGMNFNSRGGRYMTLIIGIVFIALGIALIMKGD